MDRDIMADLEKTQVKLTKSGRSRSAVGRSSKQKGKAGERYFVDILTEEVQAPFQRVPNSGAFVGLKNRDRLKIMSRTMGIISLGDIIAPDDLEHFCIFESKNYADLDFHNLLNPGGCEKLIGWLEEMLYDVESALTYIKGRKVVGFLCVKITRKGNWIVGNLGNMAEIAEDKGIQIPQPWLAFEHDVKQTILIENGWNNKFFMCDFRSFVNINKAIIFKK